MLVLVAVIRVVELLPLVALATASGTGSIVRAIAFYAQLSLAFHTAFILTVLVIAAGLLLRRQGTYAFVVTHNALILSVFSVMCFVSFTVGAFVSSGLFVLAILALILPEARREAEEGDYERPPLEAAMRVIQQRRQFRESAPAAGLRTGLPPPKPYHDLNCVPNATASTRKGFPSADIVDRLFGHLPSQPGRETAKHGPFG